MEYPSKLIEDAVNEVAKLPGIGKKTALRLVLHLIKQSENQTLALTESLNKLRQNIKFCRICNNISDAEECVICKSHKRDRSLLCLVEDTQDVIAIENTAQYIGIYHVLGGVISPMNGVGPSDLKIDSLIHRLQHGNGEIKEIILALSPTMEGDTTSFYINRKLAVFPIKITSIARKIMVAEWRDLTKECSCGNASSQRNFICIL